MPVANISVTSTNYNGEVLGSILTQAFLGNEIAEKGVIHVEPGIEKKFSIPRMRIGKLLQKRIEQPESTDAKGDITYDEKELNPEDMMVYTEFNPKSFEAVWRKFQPTGNMVFYQLPPEVQTKMLSLVLQETATEVGWHFINGVKGSGDEDFFFGIVARIFADSEVNYASTTETTWVKKLEALKNAVPAEIVDNPRLAIIMNTKDYSEYDAELKAQYGKNIDPTGVREQAFDGTRIVRLAYWPKGLVIATLVGEGEESNLWAGVNLNNDGETLFVDKVSNAGEKYFVKILLKADTNIAWGGYVTVLDKREQGTATLASTVVTADGKVSTYTQTSTLSDNVTYTISTTGAVLGQTLTVANSQSAAKTITIGTTVIAKGAEKTFHYNGTAWV